MVFTLLPTFLCDVLGASKTALGLIEGVAIFLAFAAKVGSGILSDYWRTRKPLIMWGTFFSILVKILFATASGVLWVFFAKSIDRLSKGVRSAPTDALIADLSPRHKQGRNYGLRYSLYTLGAVLGGGLAAGVMWLTSDNFRVVFWLSTIPAFIALIILWVVVKESRSSTTVSSSTPKNWHWRQASDLPLIFWQLLGVSSLLMLARFSEAFLTLQAKELGWSIASLPLLMVGYDLVNAGVAWPIGKLADFSDRKVMLLFGIAVLILVNITIIFWQSAFGILLAMLLAGLHMGMTQGLIATLVAENTLAHLRGTAFALYYLTSGFAVLIGNYVAGFLSDHHGSTIGAFKGGLVFSSLAALYLLYLIKKKTRTCDQLR
jgi:MFS family permease